MIIEKKKSDKFVRPIDKNIRPSDKNDKQTDKNDVTIMIVII